MSQLPPRIIGNDSPLACLPASLLVEQARYLEGVRWSIDVADLAYRRLVVGLYKLAELVSKDETVALDPDIYVPAISDAWAFADASWRIKAFIIDRGRRAPIDPATGQPYDSDTSIPIRDFHECVKPVKALRHNWQHIDDEAARRPKEGRRLWGRLSWLAHHPTAHKIYSCMILPGSLAGTERHPILMPGRQMHAPVDSVTLAAFDTSADLSALYRAITKLTQDFERVLRPQTAGLTPATAAMLVGATIEYKPEKDPEGA